METELGDKPIIGVAAVQHPLPLLWQTSDPVWVDEWSLSSEKLHHFHELVQERLTAGHIIPPASPRNSPVFMIWKKNCEWHVLQDLQQINAVVEEMELLQSGLPSATVIPKD